MELVDLSLDIRIEGLDRLQSFNSAVAEGLGGGISFEPIYGVIHNLVYQDQQNRYAQLAAGGGEWPPLKPSTIRRKHGNSLIMINTGALKAATALARQNIEGGLRISVAPIGTSRGVTLEQIAEYHFTATPTRPARPVMGLPLPETQEAIGRAYEQGLRDLVAQYEVGE